MTASIKKFACVCCTELSPNEEVLYDKDLDGPVCQMCHKNLKWAQAWLKNGKYHECKDVQRFQSKD